MVMQGGFWSNLDEAIEGLDESHVEIDVPLKS